MAGKTPWKIKIVSLAAALTAAGCFWARYFPFLDGQQAVVATADMVMPRAAQQVMTEEQDIEDQMVENDEAADGVKSTPAPSPTPSPTATPSPTPIPTPKPGAKAIPINETIVGGGTQWGNMDIRNATGEDIDFEKELKKSTELDIRDDGTPMVLIYHTHTTESYLKEESPWFYEGTATRSQNEEETVVMVGNAIEAELKAAGFGVIHDTTVHDYPAYTGGYTRSAETMKKNLEKYPTIQITLDVHRDAIGDDNGRVKPTVTIDGKKAAQFMILSGCDAGGTLDFPNWQQNLRLALKLQDMAAELYPGLARPLNFCDSVYNENLTTGSLLVEFGTEVNTVEEASYTGTLFGQVLAKVMRGLME